MDGHIPECQTQMRVKEIEQDSHKYIIEPKTDKKQNQNPPSFRRIHTVPFIESYKTDKIITGIVQG